MQSAKINFCVCAHKGGVCVCVCVCVGGGGGGGAASLYLPPLDHEVKLIAGRCFQCVHQGTQSECGGGGGGEAEDVFLYPVIIGGQNWVVGLSPHFPSPILYIQFLCFVFLSAYVCTYVCR